MFNEAKFGLQSLVYHSISTFTFTAELLNELLVMTAEMCQLNDELRSRTQIPTGYRFTKIWFHLMHGFYGQIYRPSTVNLEILYHTKGNFPMLQFKAQRAGEHYRLMKYCKATYWTMFGWTSSFNRLTSRMAVEGIPSSSLSIRIFLMATNSPVFLFLPLYTTP